MKRKTKKVFYYDELSELFAKDRATGGKAETAKEKRRKWASGSEFGVETIDEIDELLNANDVTLDNYNTEDDLLVLHGMACPEERPSNSKC